MSALVSHFWQHLPTSSGVYIYKNTKREIIYVGKAKNLRSRVQSYFQSPVRLGIKTAKLVSEISSLEHIDVNSEVEALLLEARLIQKHKPKYNIDLKDGKSPYYIHVTDTRPEINHVSAQALAGPFLNSLIPKSILRHFRKIAPYCLGKNLTRPCFYAHLGLCNPCPGDINFDHTEYAKNIIRLKRLLKGDFKLIFKQLTAQMLAFAKHQEFESAAKVHNKIENLEILLKKPIAPDEYLVNPNLISDLHQESLRELRDEIGVWPLERIEMYDIANLSGTAATGAMTVAIAGQISPKHYRHFTIKNLFSPNDVAMLKEVLQRRLARTDWPKPDLIVLDGGLSQLSIVNWSIPTISLAKKEEIVYTPDKKMFVLEKHNKGLQLLQLLRDEAHRFSRRLHHKHRKLL